MDPKHFKLVEADPKWHRRLWFNTSGAKSCIELNPGYYQALKMSNLVYPSPVFKSVEDDVNRTFQNQTDNPVKLQANITKLRNVLVAYGLRNPTVGYCQGFNYIVARFIEADLNEEQSFWCLVQLIENILPLDYYTNLIGFEIDKLVLETIIVKEIPALAKHLSSEDNEILLMHMTMGTWIRLFVNVIPRAVEEFVWDLLFLKGSCVLIMVTLTILKMHQDQILKLNESELI